MILIGQYDSPFVRRVGIALTLYGLPFEHRPWSMFGDADKIRPYNPLTRVPTLVLDDGEVLIESHSILDYLDSLVPAADAMFPRAEPVRHQALKVAALATGLAEKAVSLFYEQRLHKEVSDVWVDRCRAQISGGSPCSKPTAQRDRRPLVRRRIGHADIAVAWRCVHRRGLRDWSRWRTFRRSAPTRRGSKRCRFPDDLAAVHPAGLRRSISSRSRRSRD